MKFVLKKKFIYIILSLILISNSFADTKYKVEKGDTLYSISKKYQITLAELRTANNLSENDVIKVGQTLVIPTADISNAAALSSNNKNTNTSIKTKEYVVKKGDTLYGIAKNCNMSVAELLSINNLDNKSVIKIGQKIKIKANSGTIEKQNEDQKIADNKNDSGSNGKAIDTRNYGSTVQTDSSVVWPVKNPKITTIKGKVKGVQLSAKKNETVTCVREGTVMYVGLYRGYGQVLFVQSKTGLIYAYTGLGSIHVKKGDYATFGKDLGTAGVDSITGNSQITFMVFQNGQSIDPVKAPRN